MAMCATLLSACTTTPSPTETIAPGNAQLRLTSATGQIEGGATVIGGGARGDGCILTALGVPALADLLDAGITPVLVKDGCEARMERDGAVPVLGPDPEIEADLQARERERGG